LTGWGGCRLRVGLVLGIHSVSALNESHRDGREASRIVLALISVYPPPARSVGLLRDRSDHRGRKHDRRGLESRVRWPVAPTHSPPVGPGHNSPELLDDGRVRF